MRTMAVAMVAVALCAVLSDEASARCGMGQRMQGQNCQCRNGEAMPMRQQLRDGSCLSGGAQQQGGRQGRRMGMNAGNVAAQGSDNSTAPATGTPQ